MQTLSDDSVCLVNLYSHALDCSTLHATCIRQPLLIIVVATATAFAAARLGNIIDVEREFATHRHWWLVALRCGPAPLSNVGIRLLVLIVLV